ncbi:hypothetical protein BTR14_21435 [Rhizobium rhizosphaerae]|uniref:Major facilitator superfamily (MFS) profile domain-containing protein n=1 Tax=Xaviernesmea rhizosphaerae TaxID=1672749 RepID=A0ABX3P7U7_9HYPH|nr:MFS transporter [Xaviernesmea rhizosphaerae]OQP83905.1 hypothetical protein BTR14_21435 [Xaviernesmea rhizosphaerae]
MRRDLSLFLTLAITQTTGWGTTSVLAVLAPAIAADLAVPLPSVFLGTAVFYVAMGLAAPLAGRAFRGIGARRAMVVGAVGLALGLAGLGLCTGLVPFLFAWGLMGVAGALFLTTAAYVHLADVAGERARGLIGMLMLVTGLAGSLFWPLTAALEHLAGWRLTLEIYAAVMAFAVAPLVLAGLRQPEAAIASDQEMSPASPASKRALRGQIFWFLVLAIALNSFVTSGMEAVGITLFRVLGADPALAIGLASFLGVLKVSGRLVELVGGKRWSALSTGLVAGALIPCGLLVLLLFGAGPVALGLCLALFGLGSGAFAVARATMPLAFYQKADYAAAVSAIALPMNLTTALAAPILSGLITRSGASATLGLMVLLSGLAFLLLLRLKTLSARPPVRPVALADGSTA